MEEMPSKKQLEKINAKYKANLPPKWPYAMLDVRERKRANTWTFIIRYTVDRRRTYASLYTRDLNEALHKRQEYQAQLNSIKELKNSAPPGSIGTNNQTLEIIADEWLTHRKITKSLGTYKNDRIAIGSLFSYVPSTRLSSQFAEL